MMKSIKTNPNSAKGPDKGKIVNKLHCILLTTLELTWLYFISKKSDMKFIILVSNLKDISPSVFSWRKKSYIHTTYTVNSFGKTFAHVRNCLLKKIHMAQTKTLTWKIPTAISIKHRILATFNKKKSILTACIPLKRKERGG
jgi:hypothetical protein